MTQPPNAFEELIKWFKEAADWVQENLGDPEIAEMIREDLGLAPGASIPEAKKAEFQQFAAGLDPDKESFADTVEELLDVIAAFKDLGTALQDEQATGWDVAYLLLRIMSIETVRVRSPLLYGLSKLGLLVTEDPEAVEEFDPALVVGLLKGEPPSPGSGEVVLQRLTALSWLIITVLEAVACKLGLEAREAYEAYYGWDPDPASATPLADQVSARAVTLLIGPPGDVSARLSLTLLGLPREHRGPALFLSFGGGLSAEHTDGDTTYRFKTGATAAFDVLVPFGGSPLPFQAGGDPSGFVRLDAVRAKAGQLAFRIGDAQGTRLDVEKLLIGVEIGADRAVFRLGMEKAALVVDLSQGDGLLAQLPGGQLKVEFGLVFTADTANGLRVEGGTQAQATLPVNASLFGVFTVHHLDVALGPSRTGRDLTVELSGAFSLRLGPFAATVDRIGMQADVAVRDGNLGVLDASLGFKPPNGIGLAIDVGVVKGGGYLFIDPARGEYAGALELAVGPVSVKAIGILSTRVPMPDGSQGWALLLMVYGQFAPIQLSFGFTLTGVGGMIGLHHGVSIDALTSGMRDGVLDDILFPKDPVGDAPRIINRLRTVFPVTPGAVTFGPMLELGWGTPATVTLRLGIIVQLDNVLPPGNAPVGFSRLVLIGQLRVQMLPEATGTPPLLKLLVDILGYYDAVSKRIGFVARLRDSKVAEITLSGMLVVQADFGEQPSFVLAAGGFHPRFKDIPTGTPAPIDRLAVGFSIGPVKIAIEGYFAVAASTVQTGASLRAQAKFGPLSIDGRLGFDAIFFFEPTFHFEVDLKAGVSVKFRGRSLASVDFKGTLSGPGLWRITGTVTFSILFWDIDKSFDESIGSAPETPAIEVDAAALVRQALQNPGNWSAQLPAGGKGMVSLGPIAGVDGLLAHPLGSLTAIERVAPLGLTLEKFGNARLKGPNRLNIESVTIGTQTLTSPPTVTESFTRAHFVDMTEEQKLTAPSFERFTAGIAVGTEAYTVPTGELGEVKGDLRYETHYLDREPERDRNVLRLAKVTAAITQEDLQVFARQGAAAQSLRSRTEAMRPASPVVITVTEAPLAAASRSDLGRAMDFTGVARFATAVAEQTLADQGLARDVQLIEAFEGG
ncbi:DUF6603 domain-containing protein [Streptomyces sp. KR55]|uniref:DUF6603 domain-containing protein n=1 Tax=Streptomyces sp. KR55 TaxID=3457425 RepID=UPI003FCF0526